MLSVVARIPSCGSFNSFEECLSFRVLKRKGFQTLPVFKAWGVLEHRRNKVIFEGKSHLLFQTAAKMVAFLFIFEGKPHLLFQTAAKVVASLREYPVSNKPKQLRVLLPPVPISDLPVAFFDGAFQRSR